MMTRQITALTVQQRNRQRVNVFLDGEFAFGLARLTAAWLQVGQELTDEKITQLLAEDEREQAYQQALKLLNIRPRTLKEIEQNISGHNFQPQVISDVLARLQQNGLVDDTRFARLWIENRSQLRPRGRRALAYELRKHGVSQAVIEQTLQDVDEQELALEAARKQARRLRDLAWPEFRQKIITFLARRGFDYSTSTSLAAQVWGELDTID